MNSSVGRSTILCHSCCTKATLFFFIVNVFLVNNTMFRGNVFLLVKFAGLFTFYCNAETLIPHYTAIIDFARERVYTFVPMHNIIPFNF